MRVSRRTALTLAAALFTAFGGATAFAADSTVHVSLWDKGPDSAMMDGKMMLGMGKAMSGGDMSMAMMGIKIDTATIAPGRITFEVVNDSKDIIHEMIVSPIKSTDVDLPYLADENRVDEETAGHLGEVAELDPGKSGALTVDLTPGLYLLYCNIPNHFVGGMWTVLTVTE
ncbi:MAG: hypothetical protein ABIR04_00275 [Cypionkella sp.]